MAQRWCRVARSCHMQRSEVADWETEIRSQGSDATTATDLILFQKSVVRIAGPLLNNIVFLFLHGGAGAGR